MEKSRKILKYLAEIKVKKWNFLLAISQQTTSISGFEVIEKPKYRDKERLDGEIASSLGS